ncbi:MAG: NUDIX hydrolase [Ktedonobacterales bacterium]
MRDSDETMRQSGDEQPAQFGGAARPAPDAPNSPWRTHSAQEVYRNRWLFVTEYAVTRPDGQPGIYGVVDPGDNATIVALDDEERVWLVGDFVYPVQARRWMLPGGKVEDGEEPLLAAQRELAEEVGAEADEWTLLGAYELTPGISPQCSYLYLARGLRFGLHQREGSEQAMQTRAMPLRDAYLACLKGEFAAAVTVLGIWRARELLHGASSGDAEA